VRSQLLRVLQQEDINFLLTNRLPRRGLTQFMGWFSRIEQPLVRDVSIALWRFFSGLDLSEAKETRFKSMHDCFVRELKEGARPIDRDESALVSPCDGIVGACGRIDGVTLVQAKGFPYTLMDLLADPALVALYRDGTYATLRLTASMYHRFHAPHDGWLEHVTHISGDTWNVNPIALKRIEKLFCKNERAVLRMRLAAGGHVVTLVPVAAILVASLRLHCLDATFGLRYRGAQAISCNVPFEKGEEMGWFEHGSTIVVFAPKGFALADGVEEGATVRMGRPLMRLPDAKTAD
jgi:phosphatidylserine decarboxylase